MNKQELVNYLALDMGTSKVQAERFVDLFIYRIGERLMAGEEVKLVGFGTFTKAKRKARWGVNPQTGKRIKIPCSWFPKLRFSYKVRESLNQ